VVIEKRDAGRDWDKAKSKVETLVNQLEAQMAALRASESQLETTRQAHYAASEGINKAQAAYYESNAEVANLENQLKQTEEARERMRLQLQQLQSTLERNSQQHQALQLQLSQKLAELTQAEALAKEADQAWQLLTQGLPDKDLALKQGTDLANASQQALNQARQRIQIEQNNLQHLTQSQQEIKQRVAQYQHTLGNLVKPDLSELTAHETQYEALQNDIHTREQLIQQLAQSELEHQVELQQQRQQLVEAERALHQAEAEARSLEKLQQSLNQESKLSQWLAQAGLQQHARLWQKIQIDPAWTAALEAVLGAKLNALLTDKAAQQRPPSALILGFAAKQQAKPYAHQSGLTPMLAMVTSKDAMVMGVLNDWLAGVYVLDQSASLNDALMRLSSGESLVNASGDIYTPHSVTYHGVQNQLQGVLERQQQLESIQHAMPDLRKTVDTTKQTLATQEQKIQALKQTHQQENARLRQLTADLHATQLTVSRLKQSHENAVQRESAVLQDLQAAQSKQAELTAQIEAKQQVLSQLRAEIPQLEQHATTQSQAKQLAESTYFALRDEIQYAEKRHQECAFNLKLINNSINELNDKLKVNSEEKQSSLHRQSETEATLALTPMETLKANLIEAVNQKQVAEANLASARNHLAEQDQALQAQERLRLQNEQQLHPMRDALEQSRLKEQESRLYFEQCLAGLQENGLDEAHLAEGITDQTKASALANKTMQLQRDIDALGAVNLAAIHELATEKERKVYLDSQMADLLQASETLEDAIRKIDKETRGKLQATFDEANRNFNELFNVLFGGGQAKLELLGEEILDTGIQVFAQITDCP